MTEKDAELTRASVWFLRAVLIVSVPLSAAVVWFVVRGDAKWPSLVVAAAPFVYLAVMPQRLRRQVLTRAP